MAPDLLRLLNFMSDWKFAMSFARVLSIVTALALSAGTVASHAAALDFSGFARGDTGAPTLTSGIGTINVSGGTVYVYRPGDFGAFTSYGGICALSSGCRADWTLDFSSAVTNLVFEAAFFNPGDNALVDAYDGSTLVSRLNITGIGSFGFGGATITRLVFDDSSTGNGFGFGNFTFDVAGGSVPEPGSVGLVGLAMAGLAVARRRKV